ncbi:MAG: hypothetical protein AABY22_25645 [Nanoarchaeota archaeon]
MNKKEKIIKTMFSLILFPPLILIGVGLKAANKMLKELKKDKGVIDEEV